MTWHIRMRHTFFSVEQMILVIVVDQHGAFGAEQFDAIGLTLRGEVGGQRIADAKVEHGAVGKGNDGPRRVVAVVALRL